MRSRKFNDEVYFSVDVIPQIDSSHIVELKRQATLNLRKRVRLCAHSNLSEQIHEMLIVHDKSCYVRPHKHINKVESVHIIEGLVDIIIFDESGCINEVISMGDYSSGLKFFYRLPSSCYHTLLIQSEVVVFHEVTNGPFRAEDTVRASWSPEESQKDQVSTYLELLSKAVMEVKDNGPGR